MKRGREKTTHSRDQFASLEVSGPIDEKGTTLHGKPFKAYGTLRMSKALDARPVFFGDEPIPFDYAEGIGSIMVAFEINAAIDDPAVFDAIFNGDVEIVGQVKIKGKNDAT